MTIEIAKPFAANNLSHSLSRAIENLDQEGSRLAADGTWNETLTKGPFGVFKSDVTSTSERSLRNSLLDDDLGSDEGVLQQWYENNEPMLAMDDGVFIGSGNDWAGTRWPQPPTAIPQSNSQYINNTDILLDDMNNISNEPAADSGYIQDFSPPSSDHDYEEFAECAIVVQTPQLHNPSTPTQRLLHSSLSLSPGCQVPFDARFLLNHYVSQVTQVMSPMHIATAPWKTIHLPCAMNALGELSAFGATNDAKASLFYSLLAISAFHLDAMYYGSIGEGVVPNGTSYSKTDWGEVGQRYRDIAVTSLSKCIGSEGPSEGSKAKYKEILMALLSMVTIGVSQTHLQYEDRR